MRLKRRVSQLFLPSGLRALPHEIACTRSLLLANAPKKTMALMFRLFFAERKLVQNESELKLMGFDQLILRQDVRYPQS